MPLPLLPPFGTTLLRATFCHHCHYLRLDCHHLHCVIFWTSVESTVPFVTDLFTHGYHHLHLTDGTPTYSAPCLPYYSAAFSSPWFAHAYHAPYIPLFYLDRCAFTLDFRAFPPCRCRFLTPPTAILVPFVPTTNYLVTLPYAATASVGSFAVLLRFAFRVCIVRFLAAFPTIGCVAFYTTTFHCYHTTLYAIQQYRFLNTCHTQLYATPFSVPLRWFPVRCCWFPATCRYHLWLNDTHNHMVFLFSLFCCLVPSTPIPGFILSILFNTCGPFWDTLTFRNLNYICLYSCLTIPVSHSHLSHHPSLLFPLSWIDNW